MSEKTCYVEFVFLCPHCKDPMVTHVNLSKEPKEEVFWRICSYCHDTKYTFKINVCVTEEEVSHERS